MLRGEELAAVHRSSGAGSLEPERLVWGEAKGVRVSGAGGPACRRSPGSNRSCVPKGGGPSAPHRIQTLAGHRTREVGDTELPKLPMTPHM